MRVVPELGERGEPSTPAMAPSLDMELLDRGRSEREDGFRPGGRRKREDVTERTSIKIAYTYVTIFIIVKKMN